MWVIGGGVIAAYLLQDQEPGPISPGDGATVGLFAGLFGAVVGLVISIPTRLMLAPLQRQIFDRITQNGDLPPQVRDLITSSAFGVAGVIFGFIASLFIGAIFATLGGLLGAVIFKKKTPPGRIDVPPSAPTQ